MRELDEKIILLYLGVVIGMVLLKMFDIITWDWIWVLSPIWIFTLIVTLIVVVVCVIMWYQEKR